MADTWPFHYAHPYVTCSQCGNRNCFGRSCIGPGCEYIERAAFNRFERPAVPPESSYSCIATTPTCQRVSTMIYKPNEFITPTPLLKSSECQTSQPNNVFHVSRVKYTSL